MSGFKAYRTIGLSIFAFTLARVCTNAQTNSDNTTNKAQTQALENKATASTVQVQGAYAGQEIPDAKQVPQAISKSPVMPAQKAEKPKQAIEDAPAAVRPIAPAKKAIPAKNPIPKAKQIPLAVPHK